MTTPTLDHYFLVILLGVIAALLALNLRARRSHADPPPSRLEEVCPPRPKEDPLLRQIHGDLDNWRMALSKQHAQRMVALDALIEGQERLIKSQDKFIRALFGGEIPEGDYGPGKNAEKRRTAEKLKQRYGISDDEAMARAESLMAYQNGSGMQGEA